MRRRWCYSLDRRPSSDSLCVDTARCTHRIGSSHSTSFSLSSCFNGTHLFPFVFPLSLFSSLSRPKLEDKTRQQDSCGAGGTGRLQQHQQRRGFHQRDLAITVCCSIQNCCSQVRGALWRQLRDRDGVHFVARTGGDLSCSSSLCSSPQICRGRQRNSR